jgi:hypothetical protein
MDATQQKGSPKQLRGRSLGTKLSEAEYAQCEKSAARRGQTLSEWCRQVLPDPVAGPAPRRQPSRVHLDPMQCSEPVLYAGKVSRQQSQDSRGLAPSLRIQVN